MGERTGIGIGTEQGSRALEGTSSSGARLRETPIAPILPTIEKLRVRVLDGKKGAM